MTSEVGSCDNFGGVLRQLFFINLQELFLAMKHISILIPEEEIIQNTVISVIGAYKIFSVVNQYFVKLGETAPFKIELVGNSKKVNLNEGMFSMQPDINFKQVTKTDLIVIPPTSLNEKTIKQNAVFVPWIVSQYKHGAEIESLCTGAFLLASTGLLDGKNCSTHWLAAEKFREQSPKVNPVADKLITEEYGIYTNGGAYSFLNLLLHLVERYCGREVAIYCSKVGQIDMERNCQSAFSIFLGQKNHADEPIKTAQDYIENNVTNKISVEELAVAHGLSKRNFERRFKKATANTPVEYIQRAKIEHAKKNLETGKKNVNEVMYEIGYLDRQAFRNSFKKFTGLLPLEYRRKYNKEAVVG
ncbi:MAG TPA: helix-turn-helix domain-containing protein [Hanamia sp.]|nr:helix-turn-helix domain-containing protein [Hanamia sp.]